MSRGESLLNIRKDQGCQKEKLTLIEEKLGMSRGEKLMSRANFNERNG